MAKPAPLPSHVLEELRAAGSQSAATEMDCRRLEAENAAPSPAEAAFADALPRNPFPPKRKETAVNTLAEIAGEIHEYAGGWDRETAERLRAFADRLDAAAREQAYLAERDMETIAELNEDVEQVTHNATHWKQKADEQAAEIERLRGLCDAQVALCDALEATVGPLTMKAEADNAEIERLREALESAQQTAHKAVFGGEEAGEWLTALVNIEDGIADALSQPAPTTAELAEWAKHADPPPELNEQEERPW